MKLTQQVVACIKKIYHFLKCKNPNNLSSSILDTVTNIAI